MSPAKKTPEFAFYVDSSCVTNSTDLKMPASRNTSDTTVIHHPEDAANDSFDEKIREQLDGKFTDDEPSIVCTDSQVSSVVSTDSHTEAMIRAAARAVIATMEQEVMEEEEAEERERQRMLEEEGYDGGTELTYEDGSALTCGEDSEDDHNAEENEKTMILRENDLYDGSASSHHEDDVFSDGKKSNRSSLNSCTDEDLQRAIDEHETKEEMHHDLEDGQETRDGSRAASHTSTAYSLLPDPLTITAHEPRTPSTVIPRPPFRTPSSVRAMQMSSPTPSLFSSPRSHKRQNSTFSRLSTPHTISPSKTKSPKRFPKKVNPLVLLHVTVLSLKWQYAEALDAMPNEGLPRELHSVRDAWKLLKDKVGDTVLERGVLLPHPQDDFEILEERLLEALELPVRPRAKILVCGHYMGPSDSGVSSADDSADDNDDVFSTKKENDNQKSKWCDICNREVAYEHFGATKQKRFRVKVYASNGLMRAGAWEAAWKEMERVDIEIEPFVQAHLISLLDSIAAHTQPEPEPEAAMETPTDANDTTVPEEAAEMESAETQAEKEATAAMRKREMEEERLREIYGADSAPASKMRSSRRRARHAKTAYGDSLPELLLAAAKVAMQDPKNVLIVILSFLVLLMAMRPGNAGAQIRETDLMEDVMKTEGELMQYETPAVESISDTVVASPELAPIMAEVSSQVVDIITKATEMAVDPLSMVAKGDTEVETTANKPVNEPMAEEVIAEEINGARLLNGL